MGVRTSRTSNGTTRPARDTGPTLTQIEVLEARKLFNKGKGLAINRLAKRYGVTAKTMWHYIHNPNKMGRMDDVYVEDTEDTIGIVVDG